MIGEREIGSELGIGREFVLRARLGAGVAGTDKGEDEYERGYLPYDAMLHKSRTEQMACHMKFATASFERDRSIIFQGS